jgi:hypothetical protein
MLNPVHLIKWLIISSRGIEAKFAKYSGYRCKSYLTWSNQLELSWFTIRRLFKLIKVVDSREIRTQLRYLVEKHSVLFNSSNCFITNFGSYGKSGNIILYEMQHLNIIPSNRIIEPWKIPELPSDAIIVFVDDLIGTGKQSYEYITEQLNLILNPSHKPFLLCLFATQDGLDRITANTNFNVLCENILDCNCQYYNEACSIFTKKEKQTLHRINECLHSEKSAYYDKGLLIAFHYAIPNNTMPIVWKDGCEYMRNGIKREWFALLPRRY